MLATTSGFSHRLGLNTCGQACTVRAFYWPSHLPGPGILFFPFFKSDVQSSGIFSIKNQLLYARCFLSFVMRGSWTSWICWLINSLGISQRVELSRTILLCLEHKPCYYQPHPFPRIKRTTSLPLLLGKSHSQFFSRFPNTPGVQQKALNCGE